MWVATKPTTEDLTYLRRIFSEFGELDFFAPSGYSEELASIRSVHAAIMKCAPRRVAINSGTPREPKDLYEQRQGLCFDLSRSIEKGLRSIGFKVRHVSIFSREQGISQLRGMFLPSRKGEAQKDLPGFVDSHALCDVRTEKGWLTVDSLSSFLSLDDQGTPITLRALQRAVAEHHDPGLDPEQTAKTPNILRRPFTMIYGLYSRHGRFYPPYLPYPNVNPREFTANFAVDS